MTNNNTAPKLAAPNGMMTLIEKKYGVPGAVVAYRSAELVDRPFIFQSFAIMATPDHIREGMEAMSQECPDTVGIIDAEVDGAHAVVVCLNPALSDQLAKLVADMPFVSTLVERVSKQGRKYLQVSL